LYGKASRALRLPQPVDTAAASAKHVDGVLRLTLPKRAASNGSRLAIN
jgi:HSP20 family molecular chaperone IbpA